MDFVSSFENILIDVRGKKLEFNINELESDFDLGFRQHGVIITAISPNDIGNDQPTLVDTGAFQCMAFERVFEDNLVSSDWVYPSAMGQMHIDYFSDVDIYMNGENRGKVSFGVPNNLPPAPFSYVLGVNFISQFRLLVDNMNNQLRFVSSTEQPLIAVTPHYTLNFQIMVKSAEIIVSNIRGNCSSELQVGDVIQVPGLDMSKKDRINEIYNRIIYLENREDVKLIVNGEERIFSTYPLFM